MEAPQAEAAFPSTQSGAAEERMLGRDLVLEIGALAPWREHQA